MTVGGTRALQIDREQLSLRQYPTTRIAACAAVLPDLSTEICPAPRSTSAVSRPLMPGAVKYSA